MARPIPLAAPVSSAVPDWAAPVTGDGPGLTCGSISFGAMAMCAVDP